MARPLRFTGCWPPVDLLDQYPNWVFASDEECEPDQDETTIKPEGQQTFISEETDVTAANVTLASGVNLRALLSLFNGKVVAIDVYNGHDWWRLCGAHDQKLWTPHVETWKPENQRRPVVSLSDRELFPAIVNSRLPFSDGRHITITILLEPKPNSESAGPWYKFW